MKVAKYTTLFVGLIVLICLLFSTQPDSSDKAGKITLKTGGVIECLGGIGPTNAFVDVTQEHISCRKNLEDLGKPIIDFKKNKTHWIKLTDISKIEFED